MTFKNILDKFRKYAFSERDKEDKFEKLMPSITCRPDPKYATFFQRFGFGTNFHFVRILVVRIPE